MIDLLEHFEWFFTGVLVIILLWLADRMLGVSPVQFLRALASEFRELADRQWTTGSVNAVGVLCVSLFGFLLVLERSSGDLTSLLTTVMAPDKAAVYGEAVSLETVMIAIVCMAALSTFFTLLRELGRP